VPRSGARAVDIDAEEQRRMEEMVRKQMEAARYFED
jgi:hypothetical protein